jgi:hypothetical protein
VCLRSIRCAADHRESSCGRTDAQTKSPPFGGRGKSYYRPKGAGSDSKCSITTLTASNKETDLERLQKS